MRGQGKIREALYELAGYMTTVDFHGMTKEIEAAIDRALAAIEAAVQPQQPNVKFACLCGAEWQTTAGSEFTCPACGMLNKIRPALQIVPAPPEEGGR